MLDTWFSSGLWPFSTLGWGNGEALKNEKWFENDLKEFYPNTLLITGFDILFFWVARMMFSGEHTFKELPFKDIYLHALVKDEHGQKMSKSKGNVIDPLDSIAEYSADTLRFTLAILAVQGRDIKLSSEKLEQIRNFTNKLYNASRFLLMNASSFEDLEKLEIKTALGAYMKSRLAVAQEEVREHFSSYRFNDAATTLYRFLWGEFCDWGIELSKADKPAILELGSIFKEAMKLLHPFMPFISEFLYQELSDTNLEESESIMVKRYPRDLKRDASIEQTFELVIEAIVGIRRAKANIDLANKKIEHAYIKVENNQNLKEAMKYISLLAKVENIDFTETKIANAATDVGDNVEVFIPLNGVDLSPIIERLNNQKIKLEKEIQKLSGMLSNERFVANAPKEVIAENQKGLDDARAKMAKIDAELSSLGM